MKFLITLFFLSDLNAQVTLKPIVQEMLSEINVINEGRSMAPEELMCVNSMIAPYSSVKKNINSMFNKCAIDICGLPSENKSIYISDNSYASFLSEKNKEIVNKESKTIEKIIKKSIQNKKEELGAIKELMKNSDKKFDDLMLSTRNAYDEQIFLKYVQVEFVKDKDYKQRIQVRTVPPDWADENFKMGLSHFSENYKNKLLSDDKLHTKISLSRDEQVQRLKEFSKTLKDNFSKDPELLKGYGDKEKYEKFVEDMKKVSQKSFEELNSMYFTAYSISYRPYLEGMDIHGGRLCRTSICTDARKAYFKSPQNKKMIEKYENYLLDPKVKNQAQNTCKAVLISSLIETSDREKAEKVFKDASVLIKKKYLTRFPEDTRKMLENYLDNSLTMTSNNIGSVLGGPDVIEMFKQAADEYLAPSSEAQTRYSHILLDKIFKIHENLDAVDITSDVHPCGSYATTVWDAFLSVDKINQIKPAIKNKLDGRDLIFISPFSGLNASDGISIVAHEIGHALNNFLKLNKIDEPSAKIFQEMRNCATRTYTKSNSAYDDGFIHKGDSILTEEDHSDLIAFIAVDDKKIYHCSFLKPSLLADNYIDLTFVPGDFDTHSNSFARVILEAINKDIKLPESCNELIEEVKPEMRFSKCI